MWRRIAVLALPVGAAFILASEAKAQFASEPFDYPNGNLAGANGGTGWTNAWATNGGNPANLTATVTSGQAQLAKTTPAATVVATAFRSYNPAPFTLPYSINFQMRPVSIAGFEANEGDAVMPVNPVNGGFTTSYVDYLQAFSRSNATLSQTDFAGDGTWLIRSRPTAGTATADKTDDVHTWHLFNYAAGVQNDFADAQLINTGITLTPGTNYSFRVDILGGGRWNATVSDGTNTFNSTSAVPGGMGFRSNALTPSGNVYFGIRDGGTDVAGDVTLAFDNIVVPEPASAGLVGLAAFGLLARRRHGRTAG